MELRVIGFDELTEDSARNDRIFVDMPFLYEPSLLELKKSGFEFVRFDLRVNPDRYKGTEVAATVLRYFGIPGNMSRENGIFFFQYDDSKISVTFSADEPSFSWEAAGAEQILRYTGSSPWIERIPPGPHDPVIVLPEGTGQFYMELDRRESESESRRSIIGDPAKLVEIRTWLNRRFNG